MTGDSFVFGLKAWLFFSVVFMLSLPPCDNARAEGWFNPGMEGGGSALGEYDLNGNCLYYAKTADADTYLCRSGTDEVTLTCGATAVWVCNASGCDLAGELGSVTSLDATTETTIESAIDTLSDIATGSIAQGDDKSVCQGADTDFCCEWDTDGTEGLLCTAADCDGIGTDCDPLHLYQDSGNLIADLKGIDSITNSNQKITVGLPAASSYSLGANQVHITGTTAEFEPECHFDGRVRIHGHMWFDDNEELYWGSGIDYIMEYENAVGGFNMRTTSGYIWYTKDGDQDFFLGTRAQGIQLDANSTDGVLSVLDELDGDATISVAGLVSETLTVSAIEEDLTAGACTAGRVALDNGGATRELCRCNDAGTAYDCWDVTTTNGPKD